VCAADFRRRDWPRLSSGDAALDRLLGGGWVRPSAALVWGRAKSGKSRLVYRWASAMGPALVVSLEMGLELTIDAARNAGADLRLLHVTTELEGWEAEAERLGARVVVLDSISAATLWPVSLLRGAYAWAQRARAVVFAIAHVNKRGGVNGPAALEHWPDYPVRVARGKRGSAVVSLPQGSRFCGPGSVVLPIV
jgi:predicted ATP-dependent serine protease